MISDLLGCSALAGVALIGATSSLHGPSRAAQDPAAQARPLSQAARYKVAFPPAARAQWQQNGTDGWVA